MNKIIAPDGKYYTQAADVPFEERVYANIVYLGKYDSPENWRLAEAEEKDAWEEEMRRREEPVNEETQEV